MTEPIDLSLLQKQDRAAFAQLVRLHHGGLKAVARAIVGSAQAEEVVQEAWASAWKALPKFEGRSSLKTWLTRIVMNAANSRARRDWREVSLDALAEQQPGFWDRFESNGHWGAHTPSAWTGDTPQGLLEQGELGDCLETTLEHLPALQRSVFVLRHVEELELAEICNVLNVSDSNVRVLLHRARLRLTESVEHYQETGEC